MNKFILVLLSIFVFQTVFANGGITNLDVKLMDKDGRIINTSESTAAEACTIQGELLIRDHVANGYFQREYYNVFERRFVPAGRKEKYSENEIQGMLRMKDANFYIGRFTAFTILLPFVKGILAAKTVAASVIIGSPSAISASHLIGVGNFEDKVKIGTAKNSNKLVEGRIHHCGTKDEIRAFGRLVSKYYETEAIKAATPSLMEAEGFVSGTH